jgi:hypothetical protein
MSSKLLVQPSSGVSSTKGATWQPGMFAKGTGLELISGP